MKKVRYHTLKLESMCHANAACQKGSGGSVQSGIPAVACNTGVGVFLLANAMEFNFCYNGKGDDKGPEYYLCQNGQTTKSCALGATFEYYANIIPCGSGAGPQ